MIISMEHLSLVANFVLNIKSILRSQRKTISAWPIVGMDEVARVHEIFNL